MVGQPADEESNNQSSHHFEWFGVFGHPVGSKLEDDDSIADGNDEERDNKAGEETTQCDSLVTVLHCVIVEANGPTQMIDNIPREHRGNAQCNGKKPGQDNNNQCLFNSALVLSPNWKDDRDTAVDADDDKEEDAAEHVEEHK